MAASLDGQQAAPLTRTLTRDSSNPSDFLLLTTARASTLPSYALPRPRYLPVLVAAAVLDFAWTALYAVPLAWEAKTGLWVAVAVSWLRSVLVLAVVTSVRVRERSAWILAQLMLSFLVLLYHVNELVQYNGPSSSIPPPKDTPTPPAAPSSFLASPLSTSSLAGPRGQGLAYNFSRSVTTWYIISFGFSLLHYLLYAIFVGIRRRHNPFVGRRGASVGGRRVSGWGEQRWEGEVEPVSAPELEREELLAGQRQGQGSSEDDFGDSDEEEEFDESSEDEDDIVDIPRPSLRSRRSTASFFVDEETEWSSRTRGEESGGMPRSSSKYGTITSLAGI